MVSLTTRQNRLLRFLLDETEAKSMADIGRQLDLTPRQVNYNLKAVRHWLEQHDAMLNTIPGKGVEIACEADRRGQLLAELAAPQETKVVLTAAQRRQLMALSLLCTAEPVILYGLQKQIGTSRTTILGDLDTIETWAQSFSLKLLRRQNYGILLDGSEFAKRQAIASLLWGDHTFGKPLSKISYRHGLESKWLQSELLRPMLEKLNIHPVEWNVQAGLEWVAIAEAELGGRFTDESVLTLATALAVQQQRLRRGFWLEAFAVNDDWLHRQPVWQTAENLLRRIGANAEKHPANIFEQAYIAVQLLSGTRSENWPTDKEIDFPFGAFIETFMQEASQAFREPELRTDLALRDGLAAHIIPACIRAEFGVWEPSRGQAVDLPPNLAGTRTIVQQLVAETTAQTGITIPESEINNVTLLLRAAFIRCQPKRYAEAIVICPSGMATAQLIVARLKARLPSLKIQKVLSVRELTEENTFSARLIISTIPLEVAPAGMTVIQVHPLLLPEDITAITSWLSTHGQLMAPPRSRQSERKDAPMD